MSWSRAICLFVFCAVILAGVTDIVARVRMNAIEKRLRGQLDARLAQVDLQALRTATAATALAERALTAEAKAIAAETKLTIHEQGHAPKPGKPRPQPVPSFR
jgi:hypothetical protein